MDLSNINWPQLATIVFGILILYEAFRIIIEHGDWKRVFLGVLWGVHLLIFYVFVYADQSGLINVHTISPTFFTDWSPYLRLHSAVAFYYLVRTTRIFMLLNKKIQATKNKLLELREQRNVK